jgi:hypothetical protein
MWQAMASSKNAYRDKEQEAESHYSFSSEILMALPSLVITYVWHNVLNLRSL